MRFLKDYKEIKGDASFRKFHRNKKKIQLSFWLKKKETRIF